MAISHPAHKGARVGSGQPLGLARVPLKPLTPSADVQAWTNSTFGGPFTEIQRRPKSLEHALSLAAHDGTVNPRYTAVPNAASTSIRGAESAGRSAARFDPVRRSTSMPTALIPCMLAAAQQPAGPAVVGDAEVPFGLLNGRWGLPSALWCNGQTSEARWRSHGLVNAPMFQLPSRGQGQQHLDGETESAAAWPILRPPIRRTCRIPPTASGAKLLKITVKSAIDVHSGGARVILFVVILHSNTTTHEYSNDDRILALQSKGHQPC